MQIERFGESLAIKLPADVVAALGVDEGDDVELIIAGVRQLEIAATPDISDRVASLRKYRGSLPADFKFDREEANAR